MSYSANKNLYLTLKYEKFRAVSSGLLENANSTFLMLILVRWFNAGAAEKSLIACASSLGFVFCPIVMHFSQKFCFTPSRAAQIVSIFGGFAFLLASMVESSFAYSLFAMIGASASLAIIPLRTQIYDENYPVHKRGVLYSQINRVRIFVSIGFGLLGGFFLTRYLWLYQVLVLVFAIASFLAAYSYSKIPSTSLSKAPDKKLFQEFKYLKEDKLFRQTIIAWIILGFANLMLIPLRVEYLTKYLPNIHLSELEIAMFVGIIPSTVALLTSSIWGRLFDKLDFFQMRTMVNICFMLANLSFFLADKYWSLILGAIIFGISASGGEIAWNLWVTKFSPRDKIIEYSSIHTFFTGVRGIIAPTLSFYLLLSFPISTVAWISTGLLIFATFYLYLSGRKLRKSKLEK